jgi:hypothetical protein
MTTTTSTSESMIDVHQNQLMLTDEYDLYIDDDEAEFMGEIAESLEDWVMLGLTNNAGDSVLHFAPWLPNIYLPKV